MIEELIQLQALRELPLVVFEHGLDPVHDVERRSVARFVDAHQNAALAVGEDDVGLRRETVADMSDVAHVGRGAIDGFHGQVVEFVYGLRAAVHFDGVFKRAHFCGAGRKDQVLRGDGVDDIHRGKAVRLKGGRIGIHGNEALFAAVREWSCRAGNRRQLRTDKVVAEVEELLLAERIARESDLNDGNCGGGIDNDKRRRGAGRQKSQEGL